jgi:hypothetical protein
MRHGCPGFHRDSAALAPPKLDHFRGSIFPAKHRRHKVAGRRWLLWTFESSRRDPGSKLAEEKLLVLDLVPVPIAQVPKLPGR